MCFGVDGEARVPRISLLEEEASWCAAACVGKKKKKNLRRDEGLLGLATLALVGVKLLKLQLDLFLDASPKLLTISKLE